MIFLPLPVVFHSKKKNQFTTKNNHFQANDLLGTLICNLLGVSPNTKKLTPTLPFALKARAALKIFNFGQALNNNKSKALRVKIIKRVG